MGQEKNLWEAIHAYGPEKTCKRQITHITPLGFSWESLGILRKSWIPEHFQGNPLGFSSKSLQILRESWIPDFPVKLPWDLHGNLWKSLGESGQAIQENSREPPWNSWTSLKILRKIMDLSWKSYGISMRILDDPEGNRGFQNFHGIPWTFMENYWIPWGKSWIPEDFHGN